jgi:hypothetical protein
MLMDLLAKARNPFTLALLDPAVVSRYTAEKNPFFMCSSSQMDVGGSTSTKNDLLLDGAPTQIGPKGSYSPPMDAVQEFSIQQNSVDAEDAGARGSRVGAPSGCGRKRKTQSKERTTGCRPQKQIRRYAASFTSPYS